MAKPLSPDKAVESLEQSFPTFVIDAVNVVIKKNFKGKGSFEVKQKTIIEEILKRAPDVERESIFSNNWLEFEKLYEKFGWKVTYTKPMYYAGDNFDAFYEFSPKKKRKVIR